MCQKKMAARNFNPISNHRFFDGKNLLEIQRLAKKHPLEN